MGRHVTRGAQARRISRPDRQLLDQVPRPRARAWAVDRIARLPGHASAHIRRRRWRSIDFASPRTSPLAGRGLPSPRQQETVRWNGDSAAAPAPSYVFTSTLAPPALATLAAPPA